MITLDDWDRWTARGFTAFAYWLVVLGLFDEIVRRM